MSSGLDNWDTTLQASQACSAMSHACSSKDMQGAVSSYTFLPDHLIEVLVPSRMESSSSMQSQLTNSKGSELLWH